MHSRFIALLLLTACSAQTNPTLPPQLADTNRTPELAQTAPEVSGAPRPALYVANLAANSVSVFLESANGSVAPSSTLSGTATGIHAPAAVFVSPDGRIFVANATNTIEIFRAAAAGNIAPMTTITCGGLNRPSAMAMDSAGTLYVANAMGNSVSVFGSGARGCIAGNRIIAGSNTHLNAPMGIAITGGRILVANSASNSIVAFAQAATGNVLPAATIAGLSTKLNQPHGLGLDVHGNVYTSNAGSVTEYRAGMFGNAAPIRDIAGASTTLMRTAATAVSISGKIITLDASRAIDTFAATANGNAIPGQRVIGSALTGSSGLAIFEALQVVGVHLFGESSANVPPYGFVLGYFNGITSPVSQVVHLTAGDPVVFRNVDSAVHTGSFLGNATATAAHFPASFNGSFSASPAGTAIGMANFGTGTLNGGQTSATYFALPGFYMLGCAFHYDGFNMRTVIVVQ